MNVTININGDIFFKGINPFDKGNYPSISDASVGYMPTIDEDEFLFDDEDPYTIPEFLTLKETPVEIGTDKTDPVGTGIGNTIWVLN